MAKKVSIAIDGPAGAGKSTIARRLAKEMGYTALKTLDLSYNVDSFYIDNSRRNKIYGVYDTNGNIFIFETNGVMQYAVYLDDYTVEI